MTDSSTGRDLAVLRAAVENFNRTGRQIDAEALARMAGLDDETTQIALAVLYRKGCFDEQTTLRGDDRFVVVGIPTEQALSWSAQVVEKTQSRSVVREIEGFGGDVGRKVTGH